MNLTEQAAIVLAELDAELAICEKAAVGPWYYWDQKGNDLISTGKVEGTLICGLAGFQSKKPEFRFIASARTVCPTALRCLKTAIEGLLQTRKSAAAIKKIHWGDDGDCGADGRACDIYDFSTDALTTLINQWNSK